MVRSGEPPQEKATLVERGAPGAAAVPRTSLLFFHQHRTRVVPLSEGRPLVVGRDESADVSFGDDFLSRHHARFELRQGVVWLEDLGATNATQLNGAPVRHAPVQPGDEVTMGGLVAAVHVASLPAKGPAVLNHDRFLAVLEAETARCRLFARGAVLVMLEGEELVKRADEVGELPLPAQAALLRVLETKRLTRVGSTREIPADVRIIAATNRDLEAMSSEGRFRQDLYFRLNVLTLHLPPLRERIEELPTLVALFIEQANEANGRAIRGVDDRALLLLCRYPWPGNIRELRNAIERATVIARGTLITPADLPLPVRTLADESAAAHDKPEARPAAASTSAADPSASLDLNARVHQLERDLVVEALRRSHGDRGAAARLLRIPPRTLSHKIQRLGLRKDYRSEDD
jgi:hypothetical protein